jgi:hypothetical protein
MLNFGVALGLMGRRNWAGKGKGKRERGTGDISMDV